MIGKNRKQKARLRFITLILVLCSIFYVYTYNIGYICVCLRLLTFALETLWVVSDLSQRLLIKVLALPNNFSSNLNYCAEYLDLCEVFLLFWFLFAGYLILWWDGILSIFPLCYYLQASKVCYLLELSHVLSCEIINESDHNKFILRREFFVLPV